MSFALFALDSFSKILYLRTKFVDQYICYFSQWKKQQQQQQIIYVHSIQDIQHT